MNIFFLDTDPEYCAKAHCDKHCVKQILETAQLLSSAHWMTGGAAPYRLTHKNHPCAVWTRKSLGNYRWLVDLGFELCNEYTYRYGKTHKTSEVLLELARKEPPLPEGEFTPPPQCMPSYCKNVDTVEAYREYYRREKAEIAKWQHSDMPTWFFCRC